MTPGALLTSSAILRTLEDQLTGQAVEPERRAAATRAVRFAKRPSVSWTRTPDGGHLIDTWVLPSSRGLDLAHAAVQARGAAVPLCGWAPNAARNCLRRAARQVEHHSPALTRALREVKVTAGRGATYNPTAWHCDIQLT